MPVPHHLRHLTVLLASLLIVAAWGTRQPVAAAEVLELRLDGLDLPISLTQLEAWSERTRSSRRAVPSPFATDLEVWLELLDPVSRRELNQLLHAPLLQDPVLVRQLLDSWAGSQMLAALGGLLTAPDGESTTTLLQSTLRQLLQQRRQVTVLELLRALPLSRISLQIDGLLQLGEQWRGGLEAQGQALRELGGLGLRRRRSVPLAFSGGEPAAPLRRDLAVPHRDEPLPLRIWPRSERYPAWGTSAAPDPWVLVMPGLGGDAEQLAWLAAALADSGWSTLVLQHPGSDAAALKAALEGQRPPPGAETLSARLADVEAVLAAQRRGELPLQGNGVVLMGHSLGGLTALLAAGLEPEPGLEQRCRQGRDRLPITNPSRLLQCQLAQIGLPQAAAPPADLRAVVLFNGFGSLLWPRRGLHPLRVPLLSVGGSLDLVTPPLQEQLRLFLPQANERSRLVLVQGGSHFSPVRMTRRQEALFQLGEELVGVNPVTVQGLLLRLTSEFLLTLDQPIPLLPQERHQEGLRAYVLDPAAARHWQGRLGH